jgi:hypothetical protein
MIRTTEASRMAVSLAFATALFLLLATACRPSGKPAAPHRSPHRRARREQPALGLATFQGTHATEWPLLMAGNVLSLVPMLIIFIVAQRYFVRSVAATGLAGT